MILKLLQNIGIVRHREKKFNTVEPEDFEALIKSRPKAMILDVGTDDEFRKKHIPGACHMDVCSRDFLKSVEKLEKHKTYLVYCRSGQLSGMACEILSQQGIQDVYNLRAGTTYYPGKLVSDE